MTSCPFFHTHHAPAGAWSSLTFGAPGTAVSVDFQEPNVKKSGALLAGAAFPGGLRTIAFADQPRQAKPALTAEGDKETAPARPRGPLDAFGVYPESEITRTLTPSCDAFSAGKITFSAYTPCAALPDGEKGAIPAVCCLPGILLEVTVDNTEGEAPCTAFLGFLFHDMKRIFALEDGELCMIRYRDDWMFSAAKESGAYLARGLDAARLLAEGAHFVHQNGPAFLCLPVPAGEARTLTVSWSVYAEAGSNGALRTRYYYNRYFHSLEEGAAAVLRNAGELKRMAREADAELARPGQDPARKALFCQAVRAYYASSQLLEDETGRVRWNIGEGAYIWRNTMDLCADHIAWELRRNPWIVRCLMDEFIEDYSYTDRVTFPGRPGDYPGGLSFTHDMGCYFTYSPRGASGYERANDSDRGFYFYMTTEELLNGIYCTAGYALQEGDAAWLRSHDGLLAQLMESLENRDAPVPEERNGILKASSVRGGTCGLESTTYDALDHSLLEAAGNLYVFVKTWCALVLLRRCCALAGDAGTDARAAAMLEKCRRSAALFRTPGSPILKANAYRDIPGAVIAAAEALAIPYSLGALTEEDEPELFSLLRAHCAACLEKGVCLDAVSGGLRLSSTSRNTWPSKAVLAIYAMEEALGLTMPAGMVEEVVGWAQQSAREVTISDQILCDTREVVGAPYYPRIVTSALWL
ncbi:MAG TPA: hypothetical protein IAB55_03645 [Candidatus Merdivicinus faecavium]|nr:hypothetical protein [Candidatus Merdivicinus faecavium]